MLYLRASSFFVALFTLTSAACGPQTPDVAVATECVADKYAGNDSEETAHSLPEMSDDPDSSQDVLELTVTDSLQEDWFKVHIKDTGLGGNPIMSAAISNPSFELTAWFVCDSGRITSPPECQFGSESSERVDYVDGCAGERLDSVDDGNGSISPGGVGLTMVSECSGTSDDDGTLYVRVSRYRSVTSTSDCSYNLSLSVR